MDEKKLPQIAHVWRRNWVVIGTILVHTAMGTGLLFSPTTMYATIPLNSFAHLPVWFSASIYFLASLLAVASLHCNPANIALSLALIIPQHFLLLHGAAIAVILSYNGVWPTGVIPSVDNPHLYIAATQFWRFSILIVHTLSLADWFIWSRKV